MCVSLAMEIMTRVCEVCPQLGEYLYLVSCEEAVESIDQYVENCTQAGIDMRMPNLEKEHSLVAMRIRVAGRDGLMLLDPGYHVARAVTVMKDQYYPHTGWFVQSDEAHLKREYCYQFNADSDEFVEWKEHTTRGDQHDYDTSLIYVKRPYRTAVDVTVRRNLVYEFRSLLSRDAKGRIRAGIYFPVTENGPESTFTLFYEGPTEQNTKIKTKFSVFSDEKNVSSQQLYMHTFYCSIFGFLTKNSPMLILFFVLLRRKQIPDAMMNHLEHMADLMHVSKPELCALLKSLYETLTDRDYITQLLSINDHIKLMSADN